MNNFQTSISDDLFKGLDSVSIAEFYECLEKIHLLGVLIQDNRKFAKDLERWDNPNLPLLSEVTNNDEPYRKLDSKGRIRVDFENPHILKDMEYFRPAARHYEEFGCYTKFFENPDPDSDYMKFWKEERRRCIEGYARENDGEWISGYTYFFWNYGRVKDKIKTGAKTAIEIEAFPRIYDSHYWWGHYIERAETLGLFGLNLKKRRWGYSYMLASMMSRNYTHLRLSKSFILASEKEYIYRDGPMPKFKLVQSFIDTHTPFGSPRLINTMEHTKSGYQDPKSRVERGRFSEVMGVTCKDDPEKGRGKSGKIVAFEEIGVFPGLEKTWTVAEESVKQGDLTYGFLCAGGTGGTDQSDFASAEKMFYGPRGYNILHLKNIYSKTNGSGECAFFVPSYLSYEECFDKDGNSDVVKAMIRILRERQKIRLTTHDNNRLLSKKAEIPITPEEAVLRKEGSIFPVLDLKEFLATIYPLEPQFVSPHYIGKLSIGNKNDITFSSIKDITPIRHYPTKPDIDKTGALEIFELPKPIKDSHRYIIGVDPIENDESLYSVSLTSAFVFDRYTRRIVAEFTCRPNMVNDFYETVYRLSLFYNAKIMYENNKKGLYGYFHLSKNATYLLADFPEHLRDKVDMKGRVLYGNTAKGYTSSPEIKRYGRRLQVEWLTQQIYETIESEDGEKKQENIMLNLHKIRSIGYLEEASQWNPDGNFDRVDAMTAVMIYDKELSQYETRACDTENTKKYDPFFDRVYKGGNGALTEFGYNQANYIFGNK
jgi:hypothetical protein